MLFIQSYNHRTPWNDRLTEGVRDGLSRGGIKAKVTTEYLDADYWTFASECVIMRRICERARQKNTDIIITSSDEAFYTLMHCGDSLPDDACDGWYGVVTPHQGESGYFAYSVPYAYGTSLGCARKEELRNRRGRVSL